MRTGTSRLAIVLAVAFIATAADAQSVDPHTEHGDETDDPHADHQPKPPPADAHTSHGANTPPADPHADHGKSGQSPGGARPPDAAFSGPRHAADRVFDPALMADARAELRAEHGGMNAYALLVDRLEIPIGDAGSDYAWEAQAWYGGDINKAWIKSEGEGRFGSQAEAAELQALWSRAFTPWFDLQAGVRYDWGPEPGRAYLVLGLQGLMPYLFEVDAAAFLSEEGDFSARFEAEYDLRVTQRLVLQPRAELEIAAQDVPELGIGSGISDVELGVRLRYVATPELAPYAGVQWQRKLGPTADFARLAGDDADEFFVLAGASFRF